MMDKIEPSVTAQEFAVLVKRAGLPLNETQHATLFEVYGHLESMLARLRTDPPRDRAAEPSHIFVPGQGWPAR